MNFSISWTERSAVQHLATSREMPIFQFFRQQLGNNLYQEAPDRKYGLYASFSKGVSDADPNCQGSMSTCNRGGHQGKDIFNNIKLSKMSKCVFFKKDAEYKKIPLKDGPNI